MMNRVRVESQLASLERLAPHLSEHGCDISAQDAALTLIRDFDASALAREDKALGIAYAKLRETLKAIAEGRCGHLSIDQVAAFSRFYREQMLRTEIGATSGKKFLTRGGLT